MFSTLTQQILQKVNVCIAFAQYMLVWIWVKVRNTLLYEKQRSIPFSYLQLEVLIAFCPFNSSQDYWSDRSKQLLLAESILHSLMIKHSCEINQKHVIALQTDIVSKYNFRSSYVKPYLSPLFPRLDKWLIMFLNNFYVHLLSQKYCKIHNFKIWL